MIVKFEFQWFIFLTYSYYIRMFHPFIKIIQLIKPIHDDTNLIQSMLIKKIKIKKMINNKDIKGQVLTNIISQLVSQHIV